MRISDWSADVCSSDLRLACPKVIIGHALGPKRGRAELGHAGRRFVVRKAGEQRQIVVDAPVERRAPTRQRRKVARPFRSEEHTSELQSLMRNSYAVFCLKKTT